MQLLIQYRRIFALISSVISPQLQVKPEVGVHTTLGN